MKYHFLMYHIIQVEEDGKIRVSRKIFAQTSDECVQNEASSLRV